MTGRATPWDLTEPARRDYFERYGDGLVVQLPAEMAERQSGGQPSLPHGGAWLHIGENGVVTAFSGKVDVGQGTRRALAQVVANELGVAPSDVQLVMGDTDRSPWDIGTFGSLPTWWCTLPTSLPPQIFGSGRNA